MTNFCFLILAVFENLFVAVALADWLPWFDDSPTTNQKANQTTNQTTNQTSNQTSSSGDNDEYITKVDNWLLLFILICYVTAMLVFLIRAKYLNTIKQTPSQERSLEIKEATTKCRKAKEAMQKGVSEKELSLRREAMGKLIDATKNLKGLQEEYKKLARMEREGKKKIKETKLKFKKALKKKIKKTKPEFKNLYVEKLEEIGDHREEMELLKDLSSQLETAVDDFEKLDDSEIPEKGISFLLVGWWFGRTLRQIYRCQEGKEDDQEDRSVLEWLVSSA